MKKNIFYSFVLCISYFCSLTSANAQEYASMRVYRQQKLAESVQKTIKSLPDGAWLRSDRLKNTAVWQAANAYNMLQDRGFERYKTITQRTAFYVWFATISEARGHRVLWAGTATVVSGQFSLLERWYAKPFFPKSVIAFAQEGNKAIFDDVFPTFLRDIYTAQDSIVGKAATQRDSFYLRREQFQIIQPMYARQSAATLGLLSSMAKGQGVFALVLKPELRLDGALLSADDRFDFGMNKLKRYYLSKR